MTRCTGPESILFFAWQDSEQAPETCPLCQRESPILEYRVNSGQAAPDADGEVSGYCCLGCGQRLLATLQELILARWARNSGESESE
jgi:hypothetical protein